jgi:RimJ/RimL family protein N-acetyltransferase
MSCKIKSQGVIIMNIKGKFVTLRAIEEEDLELLREMINDEKIEKMIGGASFPISTYQQKEWYKSIITDNNNIRLMIETKEDGAVGFVNIVDIDWKNRSAFHGIKIANKKFHSKGIGTDAVMAVMNYAFKELQLNRLDGAIIEYNVASTKLYCEKCGWVVEGVRRNSIFKNGKYHNLLIVGILKEEYDDLVTKNRYWEEEFKGV